MTNEQIKTFALAHHAEMVEKGFWKNKDIPTKIALIIGEVYECLEAHRKGNVCRAEIARFVSADFLNPLIKDRFETAVKDTVPDEAADAMLRLLDLMAYLNMLDFEETEGKIWQKTEGWTSFANDILTLNEVLVQAVKDIKSLYRAYSFIIQMDIFDWAHVQAKRKYNATRPFLFGKKY